MCTIYDLNEIRKAREAARQRELDRRIIDRAESFLQALKENYLLGQRLNKEGPRKKEG